MKEDMSTVDSKQSYTLYEIKFSIEREMEIIKGNIQT